MRPINQQTQRGRDCATAEAAAPVVGTLVVGPTVGLGVGLAVGTQSPAAKSQTAAIALGYPVRWAARWRTSAVLSVLETITVAEGTDASVVDGACIVNGVRTNCIMAMRSDVSAEQREAVPPHDCELTTSVPGHAVPLR